MKKTILFDFDGVIATYNGWKGFDVLGDPIPETIKVMQRLHSEGYHITIFTTRLFTPHMADWLKKNQVPYDEFNTSKNNPPHTSSKPVLHCIVDDRAVNFNYQTNRLTSKELYAQIIDVVNHVPKAKE